MLALVPVRLVRAVGRAEPVPEGQKVGVAAVVVRVVEVVPPCAAVEYPTVKRVIGQVEARVTLDGCGRPDKKAAGGCG